jgi:inorganic pyrophosphatase
MEVVHETHSAWRRLISGESPAKTPAYDLSMYDNNLLVIDAR